MHERHGLDQRLQPMPGKESADKSDVETFGRKFEDCSGSLMQLRMKAILVDSIANHVTTLRWDAPGILHLRHNLATDTHHRLRPDCSYLQCRPKHPSYKWEAPDPLHLFFRQTIDEKYDRTGMI